MASTLCKNLLSFQYMKKQKRVGDPRSHSAHHAFRNWGKEGGGADGDKEALYPTSSHGTIRIKANFPSEINEQPG